MKFYIFSKILQNAFSNEIKILKLIFIKIKNFENSICLYYEILYFFNTFCVILIAINTFFTFSVHIKIKIINIHTIIFNIWS